MAKARKQPKQTNLFVREYTETELKEITLKYLAFRFESVEYDKIVNDITIITASTQQRIRKLLNKWLDDETLIVFKKKFIYIYITIPTPVKIEKLCLLIDQYEPLLDRAPAFAYEYTLSKKISYYIRHSELVEPIELNELESQNIKVVFTLFELITKPQWSGFIDKMSLDTVYTILSNCERWLPMRFESVDFDAFIDIAKNSKNHNTPKILNIFRDTFITTNYLYNGNIKQFTDSHDTAKPDTTRQSVATLATIATHTGNYTAAIKLFQTILKESGIKVFFNQYFQIQYLYALSQQNTVAADKKIKAIQRYRELEYENRYYITILFCNILLNEPTETAISRLSKTANSLQPLDQMLLYWIARAYNIEIAQDVTNNCLTTLKKLLSDNPQYTLFLYELSPFIGDFNKIATEQKMDVNITFAPLFKRQRKEEPWERMLNYLNSATDKLSARQEKTPNGTSVATSRIIYLINNENITPCLQKSKDGVNWTKGRNMALSTFKKGAPFMNATDLALAALVEDSDDWYSTEYTLEGAEAFEKLIDYPLVFCANDPSHPIEIVREEPKIEITRKGKSYFSFKPNFTSDELYQRCSLNIETPYLYKVLSFTKEQQLLFANITPNTTLPITAEKSLAELLPKLSKFITIHSDLINKTDDLEQCHADSSITVILQPLGNGLKVEFFVKPIPESNTYCQPALGSSSVIGTIKSKRIQAIRNLDLEQQNLDQLHSWIKDINIDDPEGYIYFDTPHDCLELLNILGQHTDQIHIEWPEGSQITLRGSADFNNLSIRTHGAGQWFEVEGSLTLDSGLVIEMAQLLELVRNSKDRFVQLSESEFIALSDKLRRQLLSFDAMASTEKGKTIIPAFAVQSIIDMEELGSILKTNKAFADLRSRIEASESTSHPIPKGLNAELRTYQTDGYTWLSRLAGWSSGACLADDMGLGKTIQTIALLLNKAHEGPSLVVAPASVVNNWRNELQRFAPQLSPINLNSNNIDRTDAIAKADSFDIVITTYGLLNNEQDALSAKRWNIIVLDEAHTIKNKETKMSKAAMKIDGSFRLILTGTPLQNHLSELWNLFNFATPGLLGSFQSFTNRFINPIEKSGDKQAQLRLKNIIKPFMLRRTKTQVLDELPEKTEVTIQVELSDRERALYENIRQHAVSQLESGESSPIQALAEITRLRQAACNPLLIDKSLDIPSAKAEAFIKLVGELTDNNHRALVFSQFTSHLNIIRRHLDEKGIKYSYLDGATPIGERERLVRQFQTSDIPLFLISLKAGGLGLNLTAADYVIHLDPWWNPAIEDQASDRAYRIGQSRPVTIYRLIASQTIEDKILRLHSTKKGLADSLLEGADMAHRLTKDEILELMQND